MLKLGDRLLSARFSSAALIFVAVKDFNTNEIQADILPKLNGLSADVTAIKVKVLAPPPVHFGT